MATGDTPEVLAKIDLLIELVRRQDTRIDRLEAALVGSVSELRKDLADAVAGLRQDLNDTGAELRQDLNESTAGLRQDLNNNVTSLRKEIADVREYVAEFRGEVRGLLNGMSQRISDVNARLPVPIAYAPPSKPAAE